MKPNPFVVLNHFTVPFGMFRVSFTSHCPAVAELLHDPQVHSQQLLGPER